MRNINFINKKGFLTVVLLFIMSSFALGQSSVIEGTVLDNSTGDPLVGVNVRVEEDQTIGTASQVGGKFTLEVPNSAESLIFSFVGYEELTVPISNNMIVRLSVGQNLDELVVVGYGTQRKGEITGAISTTEGKVLKESPVPNISNSIAGRVAGVSMRPNGAEPGNDNPDIHIRGIGTMGNSNPLVVVDGIIRDNINQVDPNTIQDVTILKDAAAVAPYGLGGANGVILITTKRGNTGKAMLSLNASYGFQRPTVFPKMLGAQDYMRLRNEAYFNENPSGNTPPFSSDLIDTYIEKNSQDPDRYPMSNASRKIVNMNTPLQNYDVELSGGTDVVKYYTSLGYFGQKGMFDPVNYKRYSYTLNVDVQATNTTKVSASVIGSVEKARSIDAAITSSQLFRSGFKFVPNEALFYSNGLWGEFAGNSPIGVLSGGGYDKHSTNTLLTTLAVEQQLPIKGLSLKGTFSYDPTKVVSKGWHTPFVFFSQDLSTTPYSYTESISTSEGNAAAYNWLQQDYVESNNYTYQGYLNYQNSFGKHSITGLLVAEVRNIDSSRFMARREHFDVNIDELDMGSSDKQNLDNTGMSSTGSQIGFVYRLGYDYDHKYLLEVSGRYDGHYYFAPEHRWGFFPAFSLGWVMTEEQFMENRPNVLNYLKLRGSWGQSGNLAGTAFQYLTGFDLAGNAYAYGTGNMVQGSSVSVEPNPNITWEIANKTDVGLDATLLVGKVNLDLTFDYFHEKRNRMLLPPNVVIPIEYGLSLADENAGIMSTNGIEFSLGTQYVFQNEMKVGFSGNFSYAKNKMDRVFETSATRNNPHRARTGRPFNTPFGYHVLGIFTTDDDINGDGIIDAHDGYDVVQFGELHPGDLIYADIDGPNGVPDGKIDAFDEVPIGYPVYPAITYGFTPTFDWKGIDLSLFFQGAAHAGLDVRGFQTIPFNNNNSNATEEYFKNRWTPQTQNAKYPRANQAPYANNNQLSDFWIFNTDYLRLKTINVGYTFPKHISEKIGMSNLRIYFSGQNLVTFSKLDFMDPEVGYTDVEVAYPNQKAFNFGLNISF